MAAPRASMFQTPRTTPAVRGVSRFVGRADPAVIRPFASATGTGFALPVRLLALGPSRGGILLALGPSRGGIAERSASSNCPQPAFRPGSQLTALKGGVSNRSQFCDESNDARRALDLD